MNMEKNKMWNEQQLNNRKRCYKCKYYNRNRCPLLANAPPEEIDLCVRKTDEYKQAINNEGSPEWFMIHYNILTFLRYVNFKRKDKLPEIGQKVVALRPGFGGDAGVIRYIDEIDDKYIYLIEMGDEYKRKYCSDIKEWYVDFWIL